MKNLITPSPVILLDMGSKAEPTLGLDPAAENGHYIFRMPECVSEREWEYAS
jgi:hypothetical protein